MAGACTSCHAVCKGGAVRSEAGNGGRQAAHVPGAAIVLYRVWDRPVPLAECRGRCGDWRRGRCWTSRSGACQEASGRCSLSRSGATSSVFPAAGSSAPGALGLLPWPVRPCLLTWQSRLCQACREVSHQSEERVRQKACLRSTGCSVACHLIAFLDVSIAARLRIVSRLLMHDLP